MVTRQSAKATCGGRKPDHWLSPEPGTREGDTQLILLVSSHTHTADPDTDADREMAIPRVFNSNTPFTIVAGGSELSFLGKEEDDEGREEEKDSLVQAIAPHLSRAMQHGTAKHVVTEGHGGSEENPCVSIVAQAEREDFQEFSPTGTQCPFSRSQQLKKLRSVSQESAFVTDTEDEDLEEASELPHHHHHLQRKQRRRKARARQTQTQEDGERPPVICGLWVQEIDWLKSLGTEEPSSAEIIPPPPQFTDRVRTSEEASPSDDQYRSSPEDRGGSDSDCGPEQDSESVCAYDTDSDSSCCAEDDGDEAKTASNSTKIDLLHVSGFNSNLTEWDSDSSGCVESLPGLSDSSDASSAANTSQRDVILEELRGRVTRMPKSFVSPFFEDLIKYNLKKDWRHGIPVTEGLVFHQRLQPSSCQYREGEEYCILHHIQNGSYGDVFCVQDKRTGFECAAKRIPLSHFSGEEVSTWSALNSPRVVELFGAVREGLNVVLFMDLKPACLAQLLKEMTSLPEDLSLHYLHQTLGALEHLHHKRVLHLDVKVDNVLLSADCRDAFLCDFGLSQTLDDSGQSAKAFRGTAFPGTQTHMAPEVARGDQLCAKADVWSSCCMLLHMLNGCHPWIRYYSHPLCLQIVNEPPPLWEVPSTCNNFTAKVFRAGLQKDPGRRASAKELRRKTTQALRAVGGLNPWSMNNAREILHRGKKTPSEDTPCCLSPGKTPNKPPAAASAPTMHWVSPWRTTAVEEDGNDGEDGDSDLISEVEVDSFKMEWESQPKSLRDDCADKDWDSESDSDVDMYMGEEECMREKWLKSDRDYEGDWEEEEQGEGEEEEEEEEWDSSVSTEYHRALRGLFPLLQKGQTNDSPWGSEAELESLRDDVPIGTMVQTPSPEPRDDPPSCFSCSETSQIDDSEKDSDHSSDDLSSGVFSSCNSRTDGHLEWMASENKPHLHCFQGVDIWIENVQGECLRIREHRQVKVGHVAVGISEQISGKAFTLETLDRKTVSFDHEIKESCVWFRFVPAPDTCRRWRWRVRDGKLELQE